MEPDAGRVFAQQPRADAVKRSRPWERVRSAARGNAENTIEDGAGPALHFGGRPAGKRREQHSLRVGAAEGEVRDTIGERIRLAGSGAGNDEQRTARRAVSFALEA